MLAKMKKMKALSKKPLEANKISKKCKQKKSSCFLCKLGARFNDEDPLEA